MFEFYQDFALGWLEYSHKTQQTDNRATKEVGLKNCGLRVVFWTEECRGANVN
jgi:hypothetical protein